MINFEVDPVLLLARVPSGVELDSWYGKTFLSLVGFRFTKTRLLGLTIPFHQDFDEVNLRFYVRRKTSDGWRRGVVFIKEIVPRLLVAAIARAVYNENYVALPMGHHIESRHGLSVEYRWRSGSRWNAMRVTGTGEPDDAALGSDVEFITEHYWGYCSRRGGGSTEYRVEHPKWQVWRGTESSIDCDIAPLYGEEFVEYLSSAPASAFIAAGSEVSVYRGEAI
jgi:uncharacterized protein YqjF (DUF2071 family)